MPAVGNGDPCVIGTGAQVVSSGLGGSRTVSLARGEHPLARGEHPLAQGDHSLAQGDYRCHGKGGTLIPSSGRWTDAVISTG